MVAKINNLDANLRYRFGTALIWLGVLTWAPFISLRVAGQRPSLLWYLPFHLLGVIGGSRLRARARKDMGASAPRQNALRSAGHTLIIAGILVWLPFFYLKFALHTPVESTAFLPFHLSGILSGVFFLLLGAWKNKTKTAR